MRPRHVALLVAFACGWIVWHVATLTRSPVPYYDDTFFASVGDSLERAGELKLPVSPLHISGPVYLYGPIYFAVQAFVFRHLGFGIFQNRILPLLFGLGIVVVAFASVRQAGVRRAVALPPCIALALDPTLHLSMHGGRMDTVALFFILASFLVLQKSWASESALALSATSGVLAAAGILTTPRPGVPGRPHGRDPGDAVRARADPAARTPARLLGAPDCRPLRALGSARVRRRHGVARLLRGTTPTPTSGGD